MTDYERSLGDLFSFLFCFTSNYLREIWLKQGYSKQEDLSFFKTSNLKKELNDFVLSYKRRFQTPVLYHKLDSPWLPLHPIIQQFKQEITMVLSSISNNSEEYKNTRKEFERSFEDRIESHLYKDPNLEKFRQICIDDFVEDNQMNYLDFVIKDYHGYFNSGSTVSDNDNDPSIHHILKIERPQNSP